MELYNLNCKKWQPWTKINTASAFRLIKYCVKIGKSVGEMLALLTLAYSE
jgi:hypothetical protein